MKHYKVEQNSDEWWQLRIGRFTASTFGELFMGPNTLGFKKAINKVVFEVLTGEWPEGYKNQWMDRGHEIEPLAVEAYEMLRFDDVLPGGFWKYGKYAGGSPDGLIGDDGLLEVKAPLPNTMIEYMMTGKLPCIYKWQVHGQLLVTGRLWCDFMAYHPKLRPLIIRVERDEDKIKELKLQLKHCIGLVEEKINILRCAESY